MYFPLRKKLSIIEEQEQRTKNKEQRTKNKEQRTKNKEQRTKNKEHHSYKQAGLLKHYIENMLE